MTARTLAEMTPAEQAECVGKPLVMCYNGESSGPVTGRQSCPGLTQSTLVRSVRAMSQHTYTQVEEWRSVFEFEGYYEVSDAGRIRSLPRQVLRGTAPTMTKPRILKPTPDKGGYLTVSLYGEMGRRSRRVHRIVLEAFVGQRPNGMEARHIDGNPRNNFLNNLEWCTKPTNTKDQVRHGTHRNVSKIECPHGHQYVGWNIVPRPGDGRGCRACVNARSVMKADGVDPNSAQQVFKALSDAYYYQYSFATDWEVAP